MRSRLNKAAEVGLGQLNQRVLRGHQDCILEGCQKRAYASKTSLFPLTTKDRLAGGDKLPGNLDQPE